MLRINSRCKSEGSAKAKVATADSSILFEKDESKASDNQKTTGESAFLNRAGTSNANPEIKEVLNNDANPPVEEKKGILGKISALTSPSSKDKTDKVVDASKEKERIVKNKEDGKPVTEGETPTASSTDGKKGGFINKILGR